MVTSHGVLIPCVICVCVCCQCWRVPGHHVCKVHHRLLLEGKVVCTMSCSWGRLDVIPDSTASDASLLVSILSVGYCWWNSPMSICVYAFLQICATIGQFACDWDKAIKAVLGELGIVNFNLSFLFLDCWFGPPFIFQWIMFMLLPVSLHWLLGGLSHCIVYHAMLHMS